MHKHSLALATGALLLSSAAAAAAEGPYPRSTHEFTIGATRQAAESRTLASVPQLPPAEIDLKDLNVDGDHDSWFAEYSWRVRERWLLNAFAYQYKDSGRVVATKDFNYDGVEFTAGALVDSTLEIDTYAVDVLYAVHQSPRAELLVGGGLHTLKLGAAFEGLLTAGNETVTFATASDDLLAPVPNLRARGSYAFNKRFGADLTMGWLSASVDDYDGSFAYIHARLRCRLGDGSSVSVGYQATTVDISRKPGDGREQKFDAELYGPSLQFNWDF
jgi:opacity protein-like surface antigen